MGEGETVMHNSSYADRHSQNLGLPHQESGVWKVGSFLRPSRSSLQLELGSCDLYCCRTAILLGILRPERIVVVAEFVSENYRTWFNQRFSCTCNVVAPAASPYWHYVVPVSSARQEPTFGMHQFTPETRTQPARQQ